MVRGRSLREGRLEAHKEISCWERRSAAVCNYAFGSTGPGEPPGINSNAIDSDSYKSHFKSHLISVSSLPSLALSVWELNSNVNLNVNTNVNPNVNPNVYISGVWNNIWPLKRTKLFSYLQTAEFALANFMYP